MCELDDYLQVGMSLKMHDAHMRLNLFPGTRLMAASSHRGHGPSEQHQASDERIRRFSHVA